MEEIGSFAFNGCPLVDFTLPDSLTDVARYAFDDNVVVPEHIVRSREEAKRLEIEALKEQARCDVERDTERARKIQELREIAAMRKAEDAEKSNFEKEASHSVSGDARRLIASIVVRGSSKTYSVMTGDDESVEVESYSLQRNARKSRFWPVFDALIAYRKQR